MHTACCAALHSLMQWRLLASADQSQYAHANNHQCIKECSTALHGSVVLAANPPAANPYPAALWPPPLSSLSWKEGPSVCRWDAPPGTAVGAVPHPNTPHHHTYTHTVAPRLCNHMCATACANSSITMGTLTTACLQARQCRLYQQQVRWDDATPGTPGFISST